MPSRRALLVLPLVAAAGPALAQRADDNVFRLLAVARDAIQRGTWPKAHEAIERVETRLLSRGTDAWQAQAPVARGPIAQLTAARRALDKRNPAAALHYLDEAEAMLRRWIRA